MEADCQNSKCYLSNTGLKINFQPKFVPRSLIISEVSVTGYRVAHIMVLSAVGQIKKLLTSILWHISEGN
jgi:hypothetical protein